jgi:hypothetical protein
MDSIERWEEIKKAEKGLHCFGIFFLIIIGVILIPCPGPKGRELKLVAF